MSTVIQFPGRVSEPLRLVISGEVKALMGRHDVSQEDLAAWLGINQSGVSKRLKGLVDWRSTEVDEIARGFAVHPAELMGGYATGPRPDPDEGLPIVRARRDSNPKPSDPNVRPFLVVAA